MLNLALYSHLRSTTLQFFLKIRPRTLITVSAWKNIRKEWAFDSNSSQSHWPYNLISKTIKEIRYTSLSIKFTKICMYPLLYHCQIHETNCRYLRRTKIYLKKKICLKFFILSRLLAFYYKFSYWLISRTKYNFTAKERQRLDSCVLFSNYFNMSRARSSCYFFFSGKLECRINFWPDLIYYWNKHLI